MTAKRKFGILYLRSSKDRSDIAITTQERELRALAEREGIIIIGVYIDVVESAKDADRPDFLRMLQDIKQPDRK